MLIYLQKCQIAKECTVIQKKYLPIHICICQDIQRLSYSTYGKQQVTKWQVDILCLKNVNVSFFCFFYFFGFYFEITIHRCKAQKKWILSELRSRQWLIFKCI